MLKKLIAKIKKGRDWKEALIINHYLDIKAEEEDKIIKATQIMLNAPCPFTNNFCFKNCVHFEKGEISLKPIGNIIVVDTKLPRCKLWNV